MAAPTLPDSAYDLTFTGPDDHEQLMVELINRARLDPQAEVGLSGDTIASGASTTPVEALAVVPELDAAAQGHSDDMLSQNFFDHTNPFTGKDPFDRMRDAGYNYRYAGENLSWISLNSYSADQVVRHHQNLWASDGHQRNILNPNYSEIGIGYSAGSGGNYMTQKFGDRGLTYLTGVVIDDLDGDDFYDVGEGQGAVRITAWNDNGAYATSTWDAGGYSLELENGTYTVRFEGGDLDGYYETTVTISGQNVKLDVIEGVDTIDLPDPGGEDPTTGIPGDATTTAAIAHGQMLFETLETDDDTDWFQLDLSAGQSVSVILFGYDHDAGNNVGALADNDITIYDSAGNAVASLSANAANNVYAGFVYSYLGFTATSGGTYFVEASTSQQGGAGDYGLTVAAAAPVDPIPGDTTTSETIAIGETRFETLETASDTDWFQLDLVANQTASVILFGYDHDGGNSTGALVDNDITIYDSVGNVVATVAPSAANNSYAGFVYSYLDVTASLTGTYYVEASTSQQGGAGDYGLMVLAPPQLDAIPGDGTTTETIAVGESRDETLDSNGDSDWFQLDLSANQTVSLVLIGNDHDTGNGHDGLNDCDITVYDSAGNIVATVDPANANGNLFGNVFSTLSMTAPNAGTFFVEVSSSQSQSGDYTLTVSGRARSVSSAAELSDAFVLNSMAVEHSDDMLAALSDDGPSVDLARSTYEPALAELQDFGGTSYPALWEESFI